MGEHDHGIDLLHGFGIVLILPLHLEGEAPAAGDLDLAAGNPAFRVEVGQLILKLCHQFRVDPLIAVDDLEAVNDSEGGGLFCGGHSQLSSVSVSSMESASAGSAS